MIRSGDRIATGTGKDRRRLTVAEAEAGGLPEPFTREEWDDLAHASRTYHNRLLAEGARWWRQTNGAWRAPITPSASEPPVPTRRAAITATPDDDTGSLEERAVRRVARGESVYRVARQFGLPHAEVFCWALAAGVVTVPTKESA